MGDSVNNKLSLAVLRSTAEEIRYSYDPDSEEPNRVVIFIKAE